MKILLIDNYDSFTFNLYHYISSLKVKVDVVRNDKINSNEILKKKYNRIVISPGPGNPNQSGNCINILKPYIKNCLFWCMFGSSNHRASLWVKNCTSKKTNAW
jgi:anthranilate/para-aminobenzoate synthase component II